MRRGQEREAQSDIATEELEVDRGVMLVSGRGIVFASQEDIRIDFDDIEAVDHTHNGIAITARNPARRLYFEGADRTVVLLKV